MERDNKGTGDQKLIDRNIIGFWLTVVAGMKLLFMGVSSGMNIEDLYIGMCMVDLSLTGVGILFLLWLIYRQYRGVTPVERHNELVVDTGSPCMP